MMSTSIVGSTVPTAARILRGFSGRFSLVKCSRYDGTWISSQSGPVRSSSLDHSYYHHTFSTKQKEFPRNFHENKNHRNQKSSSNRKYLVAGILPSFGALFGFDDEKDKEDPLMKTIKRGIICQRQREYDKAEVIFHAALSSAVEQSNFRAQVYLYSCLGHNAFLKGEYDKSEKVYKELIKQLMSEGYDESHEAILEISLKIATIFSKTGRKSLAETGYDFCLKAQKSRVEKINLDKKFDPEADKVELNSLALYGMILDWYGKHHLRHNQYKEALSFTDQALEVCKKVHGAEHYQTMVLLSDKGCIHNLLEEWDSAIKCLYQASEIGKKVKTNQLKVIVYNLGMTYLMKEDWDSASRECGLAYKFAYEESDAQLLKMINECLTKANLKTKT